MTFEEQSISGIYKITLQSFRDDRGAFARLFCTQELAKQGLTVSCEQINQSYTKEKGSFRGIHYQFGPFAETKIIRCIRGRILDIGVDLRKNSPTLLSSYALELSEDNDTLLLLPPGVGHAFQTLTDDCTLIYFHSSFYNPAFEGGVRYDDPKINLNLPLPVANISTRDMNHPLLTSNFSGIDI